MQTFYTRVVPFAVFAFVLWMGIGALDRIDAKVAKACGRVENCVTIGDERYLLSIAVLLAAGVLAWASVRFNTSVER
ncbi:hypothetical protein [Aureimonas sp. AU40]|uniref:hypothetical protein n=1 Tax=Aureimonas sp. AU40 TaxID=1637747 RepID=UPI0007820B28|nr:hypothetical protein [Aureimonas sp. AU40]